MSQRLSTEMGAPVQAGALSFAKMTEKSRNSATFSLPRPGNRKSVLPRGLSRIDGLAVSRKGTAMNKNDLIAAVADKTGLTKAQAGEAVDAALEAVTNTLKSGDEVRIIGFGNFSVSERAASEGRNPRTGETIQIPASKTPKFKAGKGLKDAVNA